MTVDVARLEKAELHCHVDNLIDPDMLAELVADGHELGVSAEALRGRGTIDSVAAWDEQYSKFLAPFVRPLARWLPLVLEKHVARLRAQRVVYAEIFVSGLLGEFEADRGALVAAFEELGRRARAAAGPELRVELVVCVGRGPPARLERQLPRILALAAAGAISGFALAGDELAVPVRALVASFDRLHDAGLGIEIHAGEHGGAESVRDAIEHGRPHRIGHGVAAFSDPALIDRIRERGIHLEFCPTSNLKLRAVVRIEDHPIARARELGLEFSINTDDPGPFGCSITSELELVRDRFGFGEEDFARVLASARKAAFSASPARS